jgi:hypothetical protein
MVFKVFDVTFKYLKDGVCNMPEDTIQLRVYKKDWDRLKNFGRAGDCMASALSNVLDIAEGKHISK